MTFNKYQRYLKKPYNFLNTPKKGIKNEDLNDSPSYRISQDL